ncbi:MAG: TRAP transporter small permease [Methylobacteriaceae bacterium]|jgi:TRAP-type C4-dicarboxylate transport system permease small subunit|nr:TRAP transporter small permease [Methylobacteriaceae bacterium]
MRKTLLFLRDILEYYVPILAFSAMFISFLIQVFFRYVMHDPVTWTQEVIIMGFIWTVIFGACYTMRTRSHVAFTMFYDRMKPKPAAALRLLGNVLIVVTFLALIVPSFRYSLFIQFEKTAVFRIPLTVMFLSFVYFLLSVIGYTLADIVEDARVLSGRLADSREHKNAEIRQ